MRAETICITVLQILIFLIRAWKKHLRSVSKENQLPIYQTLCILEAEVDITQFELKMSQFISYWELKESEFIRYFKEYYLERAGT